MISLANLIKNRNSNRMIKLRARVLFILVDWLAAFLGWFVFFGFRKYILHDQVGGTSFSLTGSAFIISVFWVLLFAFLGFYTHIFKKSRLRELFSIFKTVIFGVVLLFVIVFLDGQVSASTNYARNISLYFLIHLFCASVAKFSTISWLKSLILRKRVWFNTLLIGSSQAALSIFEELNENNQHLGLKIRGYLSVHVETEQTLSSSLPCLGSYNELETIIPHKQIRQVIIAVEQSEHRTLEEILSRLEDFDLEIKVIPDLYQILLGSARINHVFGTPLIEINRNLMPVWQKITKRLFDIVFSLLVLLIGLPAYVAVAIITKATSPGPVFFTQERIGKNNRPFKIIKFRSMRTDAEKHGPALANDTDPRITRWGKLMRKTRIDETPQFFNVLRGEMSIVGPRPERQFFIDQIVKKAPHYKHITRVKPGITSLGQVKFGYARNVDEMVRRLKYDIIYIENMSLGMDLRILIYTVLIIVQGRGK